VPNISVDVSIPAGGSVSVAKDSIYETLPFNALVEFAALASATGLTMSASSGSDILAEAGSPVGLGSAIHIPPKYPDDFHLTDVAARSERIKFLISNPTGGALNVFGVIRLTPL
jgi:hypothetical protein